MVGQSRGGAVYLFLFSLLLPSDGRPTVSESLSKLGHTRDFNPAERPKQQHGSGAHYTNFGAGRASAHQTWTAINRQGGMAGTEDEAGEDENSPLTFSSISKYPKITWSPWDHLAEPYRQTVLRAMSTVGNPDEDIFVWSFPEENGATYEGRTVRHKFTSVGKKAVVLTQTIRATGVQIRMESFIMVKYVRREIRSLLDEDRNAFFDAMETLYRMPTSQGQAIYGSEFKAHIVLTQKTILRAVLLTVRNIDYFVQMHLDGAGVRDCDHWHDDAGIMTHHIGYTLQFEQALQLVDPSVTIPYWEYTIEAAQGLGSYGDSIMFDDDWFGEFSPDNEMHTVTKGRWAYLKVMEDAWSFVHNPYGLLRSPWNLNSVPYVTRHNTTNKEVATDMVSCDTYSSCFESDTLGAINSCLNGETHGPVHILSGGEWGDPEEEFIRTVGYYEMVPLVTKYLWRKGYLRIPDTCEPGEECDIGCPVEVYESRGMTPYDVLVDVNALAWAAHTSSGTIVHDEISGRFELAGHHGDSGFETKFWERMLHSFCAPGKVGEMYTSAAPYDPLFWVVHPTADRFLAWRRILAHLRIPGWEFDETWSYKHQMVVGETGYVCNWDGVKNGSNDMPKCVKGICGGHNVDDVLPFKVKVHGRTVKMTNAEWMAFIFPINEHLPYMYDSFRWDHCIAGGFDFGTRSGVNS